MTQVLTLTDCRPRIEKLISRLPEETDRAWLVAIYISFEMAAKLGYSADEFRKLATTERTRALKSALARGLASEVQTESEKNLRAGHYFNNGLFRIVGLAEISLNLLFKARMDVDPPRDYGWLSKWYLKQFGNSLSYIDKARKRVNKMKHQERNLDKIHPLESIKDGLAAFNELLELMEELAESNQTASAGTPERQR
jgi:hypothetical protein